MDRLNEIIELSIAENKNNIGKCKECKNYRIIWDEYYDCSYCPLDDCTCGDKFEWKEISLKANIRDEITSNIEINNILAYLIKQNVKPELLEYLPFSFNIVF